MKRWRSPGTSRRTVHAERKGSGCPLSQAESEILAKLRLEAALEREQGAWPPPPAQGYPDDDAVASE